MPTLHDSFSKSQQNLNATKRYKLSTIEGFQRRILSTSEATDLYEAGGIATRIVNRLADDATREGFDLTSQDTDFDWNTIEEQIEKLDILTTLADHIRWSRVYGGDLLVAAVNDGRKFSKPLNGSAVTGIIGFHAVPSPLAMPDFSLSGSIGSRSFLNPTHYQLIRPEDSGMSYIKPGRPIHYTRIHRLDALRVSPLSTLAQGWGPSIFEQLIRSLERLFAVYQSSAEIVRTASMLILRMKDFRSTIESGDPDKLDETINTIARNLSTFNLLAFDKDDEIFEVKRTLTEVTNIIDRFEGALISDTDMPREILFGVTNPGLNSGENGGAFRAWYNKVRQYQQRELTPCLRWMLKIIFSYLRHNGFTIPHDWAIEWRSLWEPTDKEKSEILLSTAQRDQINILSGLYSAEEARRHRFEHGNEVSSVKVDQIPDIHASELTTATEDLENEEPESSVEPPPPDLKSPKEIGEMLGVGPGSIRRMHFAGRIRGWRINGRWRFSQREVLEAVANENSNNTLPATPSASNSSTAESTGSTTPKELP